MVVGGRCERDTSNVFGHLPKHVVCELSMHTQNLMSPIMAPQLLHHHFIKVQIEHNEEIEPQRKIKCYSYKQTVYYTLFLQWNLAEGLV